jgi:hypothetical protein
MTRTAQTIGVSMSPADQARWQALRQDRRTSDFVRHLLDLEEEHQARLDASAAHRQVLELQASLPQAWGQDGAWDFVSPDEGAVAPGILAGGVEMSAPAEHGYPVGPV